jgi:hypothetical protein
LIALPKTVATIDIRLVVVGVWLIVCGVHAEMKISITQDPEEGIGHQEANPSTGGVHRPTETGIVQRVVGVGMTAIGAPLPGAKETIGLIVPTLGIETRNTPRVRGETTATRTRGTAIPNGHIVRGTTNIPPGRTARENVVALILSEARDRKGLQIGIGGGTGKEIETEAAVTIGVLGERRRIGPRRRRGKRGNVIRDGPREMMIGRKTEGHEIPKTGM